MRNTASGGRKYFTYNKDVRGSTSSIVDSQGTAQAIYYYDDFGNTTAKGNFKNEICYTGGIYDDTTGLYYLNARYYSPEDGNFMSQDTYRGEYTNPATLNFYGYCGGNPINYVDPSGHFYVRRWMIAKPINAVATFFGLGAAYQPFKMVIKESSKKISRKAVKRKIIGKAVKFVRKVKYKITKISIKITDYIKKIPVIGKIIKKNLTVKYIRDKIYGAIKEQTIGRVINHFIQNVDVYTSVGGFIAGGCDVYTDGRMNNRLWRI